MPPLRPKKKIRPALSQAVAEQEEENPYQVRKKTLGENYNNQRREALKRRYLALGSGTVNRAGGYRFM